MSEMFAGREDGTGLILDPHSMSPLLRMALLPKLYRDRSKGAALPLTNRFDLIETKGGVHKHARHVAYDLDAITLLL